jgi:hypothetical protein
LTKEHIENTIRRSGQALGVRPWLKSPILSRCRSDGIAAGEPTECFNPNAAIMRAEALSRKEGHVGAVAFSRTGGPATGDFSDAKVIRKFGDVPDDLSAL